MKRREFVAMIGGALAAPVASLAQQQARRIHRIAFVAIAPRRVQEHLIAALEQGLRDHGHVPGKDVAIEFKSVDGMVERLAQLVREVVQSNPDVIVTGVNAVTTSVKAATQSIPVVFTVGTDVIGAGYVRTFAKPGGNITGITVDVGPELVVKRLGLLKEIAAGIARVAVVWESPYREQFQAPMDAATPGLGLRTFWHEYSGNPERDFAEMTRLRAEAVYFHASAGTFARRVEIGALAIKHRLPTSYPVSEFVEAGGLMSYGPNLASAFRTAGKYIDKILKGTKPGDIPVEQPTVIDLAVNLKTAKALGIKIPSSIMARIDRMIE